MQKPLLLLAVITAAISGAVAQTCLKSELSGLLGKEGHVNLKKNIALPVHTPLSSVKQTSTTRAAIDGMY